MNEQQLLEAQLALERTHLAELLTALSPRPEPSAASPQGPDGAPAGGGDFSSIFLKACDGYLTFKEKIERARAQTSLERALAHLSDPRLADPHIAHRALEAIARLQDVLAQSADDPVSPGRLMRPDGHAQPSGLAPAAPAAPAAAAAELAYRARYVERLLEARVELEAIVAASHSLADWREISHLDADSILEERRLRSEVIRHGLPPGRD